MNINLTDNIGADIYPERFPRIITRYQNSGSFYINVNIKFEKNETQLVTPMVAYKKHNGKSNII